MFNALPVEAVNDVGAFGASVAAVIVILDVLVYAE
jgi:hypothetical protein